jgi:class 3 adenylate cyclase
MMPAPTSVDSGEALVEGRRGYVTVLFAELFDYTRLSDTIDPEDADGVGRLIERLATRVISKRGGSVSQVYENGVLAMFGVPIPHEDDARRAIEAAIELHEAASSAQ